MATDIYEARSGTPVGSIILFHGLSANKKVMAFTAQEFANQELRVFVPDLPGHGKTPGPFSPRTRGNLRRCTGPRPICAQSHHSRTHYSRWPFYGRRDRHSRRGGLSRCRRHRHFPRAHASRSRSRFRTPSVPYTARPRRSLSGAQRCLGTRGYPPNRSGSRHQINEPIYKIRSHPAHLSRQHPVCSGNLRCHAFLDIANSWHRSHCAPAKKYARTRLHPRTARSGHSGTALSSRNDHRFLKQHSSRLQSPIFISSHRICASAFFRAFSDTAPFLCTFSLSSHFPGRLSCLISVHRRRGNTRVTSQVPSIVATPSSVRPRRPAQPPPYCSFFSSARGSNSLSTKPGSLPRVGFAFRFSSSRSSRGIWPKNSF